MDSSFQHQWIDVDRMKIHLLTAGETGSPVVLLHGGGTDSAELSWKKTIPALAHSHRVYAPDWPGYGMSDRPKIDYTLEFHVGFLGRLLDNLGLEKAMLAGLSLGGGSVLGFVLDHPERVERLALVDSYGYMSKIPYGLLSYLIVRTPLVNELTWWSLKYSRGMSAYLLSTIFGDPKKVTPELIDEMFATLKQQHAGRAFTSFQRSEALPGRLRSNFMDRLGELYMPVLFIQGEKDRLVPLTLTQQAQQRTAGSKLEIIPGAGHWPNREAPEVFNQAITTFFTD